MFGRNEYIESVKAALEAAECDMAAFKSWRKLCERVAKKKRDEEERYARCKSMTLRVQEDAGLLEEMLINGAPDPRAFGQLIRDLKQMQGGFFHEFLISADDREFSSTYDAIVRMGQRTPDTEGQRLLLQSETENLLELLKENLEREAPQPEALACYYQFGTERELLALPPAERLAKISTVYENRFRRPILQLLETGTAYAKAQEAALRNASDRGSRRKLETLAVLLEQDAERILKQIMEVA